MPGLHTADKILNASIVLFSQKGYDAVTTKEIAKKAGVSEMTVFRHFDNKRNLFEQAFEKFVFEPKFKSLFENSLEWDLEKDLLKISRTYQDTLLKNQRIILMQFRNSDFTAEHDLPLLKFPTELKRLLVDYLATMKQKGVIKENPEILALNFLALNFGLFMTFLVNNQLTGDAEMNACLTSCIRTITRGIIN